MTEVIRSVIVPPRLRSDVEQPRPSALRWNVDPVRICVFLLTVTVISRLHQQFGFVGAFRPAMTLAVGAFLMAVLNPKTVGGVGSYRVWTARVTVALGVLAVLSIPFGISPGNSAMYLISQYSKVLIFAFLLIAVLRNVSDLSMFVWAYVAACGSAVAMAFLAFGTITDSGAARLEDFYSYDANDLACVLLTGLPLALLAFQTARTKGRLVAGIVLLGIGATIARSGSRGAFLGLIVVGLALLISLKGISVVKRVLFVVTVAGALVVATPSGYWERMRTMLSPTEDYNWSSWTGRRQVTLRGIGYMLDYPVTGLGLNNFGRAEGTLSDRARAWMPGMQGVRWTAPHNSFLQAGADLGIPGLILWSSLVFGGIVSVRRLRRRLPPSWRHGDPSERFLYLATVYIPISLLGFAATAFFVSFAYLHPVYYMAALMTGLHVAVRGKLAQSAVPARRTRRAARHTVLSR